MTGVTVEAPIETPQAESEPLYWTARCSCGWERIDIPSELEAVRTGLRHWKQEHGGREAL